MLYVDTSVLVALCTHEGRTAAALQWYEACTDELASAAWCVTEFASALGLKQCTGQLNEAQAQMAWMQFERICANDLQLLPVETRTFHVAARLTLTPATALRAGDALHLASALDAKATAMVTLDVVLAKNAKNHRLPAITL
jgi:predicted nucleic acid-binding protein